MSFDRPISLIDLAQQLPFQIDSEIKKEICFGETLIISCGHYEGSTEDEPPEWSCQESTEQLFVPEQVKNDDIPHEIKDKVEEEEICELNAEEEEDFHFFFFPDCDKVPPPQGSKMSLMLVDGLPKINPKQNLPISCTCKVDKKGQCECFVKLPCKCGDKSKSECDCFKLENICICEAEPQLKCTCSGSKVCLCHPDGKINVKCTCDMIKKPCICHKDKYPSPTCICDSKPRNQNISSMSSMNNTEIGYKGMELEELEYLTDTAGDAIEPCDCQKISLCHCVKGKECICKESSCICGVQKSCLCDSEDLPCINEESKSVCNCHISIECNCDGKSPTECNCFVERQCSCGNPEQCMCFGEYDDEGTSINPRRIGNNECTCLDKAKQLITQSDNKDSEKNTMKLKRMRSGKHGYRWCHEVDPRHTYFNYAYNRHDKISSKVCEQEKFKILGLDDEKSKEDNTCPVHDESATTLPTYKKIQRKSLLDCCSAVGGITISVETLGEEKDKFLVQVVSHSSKDGAKTGSKLVSILDCQLHTMEENRTEYITKNDNFKERRSYMTICENGYYNKVTRICGDHNVVKRIYHSFDDARSFLLEGANIVLLRYFGLRRYKGTVKTETVLMDGTICESIYVCFGVSQAIVNGTPLYVVKVERHIIEPSGRFHQTLTVLTLKGYTVSHEWADSAYMLHINPLLRVVPEKDEIEAHPPLRERWREDLQLLSDYLDFKSSRSSEGMRYMTENATLTGCIKDYLQAILLLRPSDALHFTRHYFGGTLSAIDLPYDEYFDPTTKHVRYYFFEQ
ncbi:hypothetical protein ACJJTC_006766 [Scirpophaga incertulas]